jgi:dTDP-4-amino-4,6-dideoxygalactose transaminase
MSMRIGRTLPPAAAALSLADLWRAFKRYRAGGRSVDALEAEIGRHFGARHVALVSSGTAALALSLRALKALHPERTAVVLPAYTCFSVPAAVVAAGLTPVLCDINPSTFDFDESGLERAIGPHTLAVVAHHLFGIASDVDRVRARCAPLGIAVIEDAAQAMGVEVNGRALGTLGDVGIFSLGRGKPLTCGSGGVILTKSDELGAAIQRECEALPRPTALETLKSLAAVVAMAIFTRPALFWIPASLPFLGLGRTVYPRHVPVRRLSAVSAALLHDWQARLHRAHDACARASAEFGKGLGLALPHGPSHPYLRLPILVGTPEMRDRIYAEGRRSGFGMSRAYHTPVSEIPELAHLFAGQRFPSARIVSLHILTIPTHHWLSAQDKAAITRCIWAAEGRPAPSDRPRALERFHL